jgi:hypothetical protein
VARKLIYSYLYKGITSLSLSRSRSKIRTAALTLVIHLCSKCLPCPSFRMDKSPTGKGWSLNVGGGRGRWGRGGGRCARLYYHPWSLILGLLALGAFILPLPPPPLGLWVVPHHHREQCSYHKVTFVLRLGSC